MKTLISSATFLKVASAAMLMTFSTSVFAQDDVKPAYAPSNNPPAPRDYGKEIVKIKKRIISFGFLSPLNQHISFGYDQLMGTDMVLTTQLGIIGPGVNTSGNTFNPPNPAGAFVELGGKFFFSPDFVSDGLRRYNSMQGGYFKPQIIISSYDVTDYTGGYYNQNPTSTRVNYSGLALMINFGKQWILANAVSLDMYVGIGYSLNSGYNNNELGGNYFSYLSTGNSALPLAFSGGLNIGVPF